MSRRSSKESQASSDLHKRLSSDATYVQHSKARNVDFGVTDGDSVLSPSRTNRAALYAEQDAENLRSAEREASQARPIDQEAKGPDEAELVRCISCSFVIANSIVRRYRWR